MGQYNIELNLEQRLLPGDAAIELEHDLRRSLNRADALASETGAHIVAIGILPTVMPEHLQAGSISARPRYAALNTAVVEARGEDMFIDIEDATGERRPIELRNQGVRPRVFFGERWITSVFDLFEENVRYFPALLPGISDEDPVAVLEAGQSPVSPRLDSTTGRSTAWNRPIYDLADGRPHLRVENRVLPAGPTMIDTMANSACLQDRGADRSAALRGMLEHYVQAMHTNEPVHTWPLP